MAKIRVYEIAKEIGIESKVLVEKLKALGFEVKSHASALEESEARDVVENLKIERKANVVEKRIDDRVIRRRRKAPPPRPAEGAQPESAAVKAGEETPEAVAGSAPAEADRLQEKLAAPESLPGPDEAEDVAAAGERTAEKARPADAGRARKKKAAGEERSGFYRAKVIHRASPPESARIQAKVISRPQPEEAKPSGIRVLKVVPGKAGRGTRFIDVSNKPDKRRKATSRASRADFREAMFDAFTPGYFPGLSRRRRMTRGRGGRKTAVTTPKALKRIIKMESKQIANSDLAKRMGVKLRDVNLKLRELG